MPYKDKDKQREAVRKAVANFRQRQKQEITELKQRLEFYEKTYGKIEYEVV
jgi:hypothetical protein